MIITLFFRSNSANDCYLRTFNSYFFKINNSKIYKTDGLEDGLKTHRIKRVQTEKMVRI